MSRDLITTASPVYDMRDMERIALALAKSQLFGVKTPDQALALCLIAQAEGRHPATAASDYSIIQGRPSKKADAMLRDFLQAGGRVEWHALSNEVADATFSHPAGGTVRIDWDIPRAKDAGAYSKNPTYKTYPRAMLRARVISEGVRTVFPAATSGMYEPNESQDIANDRSPRDVTPKAPEPRPARLSGKAARVAAHRDPEPDEIDETDGPDHSDEALDAMGAEIREEDVLFIQDAEVWFAAATDRLAVEDAKQSNFLRVGGLPQELRERFDAAAKAALERIGK
jgi:hypothetical protein